MKHLILIAALALVACSGEPKSPDMRTAVVTNIKHDSWAGNRIAVKCIKTREVRTYAGAWGIRGDTVLVDFNKGWRPSK